MDKQDGSDMDDEDEFASNDTSASEESDSHMEEDEGEDGSHGGGGERSQAAMERDRTEMERRLMALLLLYMDPSANSKAIDAALQCRPGAQLDEKKTAIRRNELQRALGRRAAGRLKLISNEILASTDPTDNTARLLRVADKACRSATKKYGSLFTKKGDRAQGLRHQPRCLCKTLQRQQGFGTAGARLNQEQHPA